MNNLHETFGEAHLDFEISDLQAKMIAGMVSFMLGSSIEYDELVNTSGQRVEFCLTY